MAPSERITDSMLTEIRKRNADFLGYAHNAMKMFARLETSPDEMKGLLSGFLEQAKKLRKEMPDDPTKAMETLMSGFLSEGKLRLGK